MSGLEQTYYIMAIVVMSFMLILLIALVTTVVVIRNKIVSLENMVKEKIHMVSDTAAKAVEIVGAVGEVARAVKGTGKSKRS